MEPIQCLINTSAFSPKIFSPDAFVVWLNPHHGIPPRRQLHRIPKSRKTSMSEEKKRKESLTCFYLIFYSVWILWTASFFSLLFQLNKLLFFFAIILKVVCDTNRVSIFYCSFSFSFSLTHPGHGLPSALIEEMSGGRNQCTTQEGIALNVCQKLVNMMNGHVHYIREHNKCYFCIDLELRAQRSRQWDSHLDINRWSDVHATFYPSMWVWLK